MINPIAKRKILDGIALIKEGAIMVQDEVINGEALVKAINEIQKVFTQELKE